MKTISIENLINGVATFNADPFCIENEEMAEEIMAEVENNGAVIVTDEDERENALAKLDLPEDSNRIIYQAGGCIFSMDDDETLEDNTEKKIYVSFHIGRGGHYNNPGHIEFVGEENFQELIHRCMDKCSIEDKKWNDDPTEEETILPDDEWQLVDNGGNVILEGRDEIEAMTGRLEWDTEYDTDYVTTTDSLSEKEEEVLWKAYTEDAYMSDELKDEICSLRWMKRVHDIKTYSTNLEVMTQDGVETIDIDQQKGLYDEDEWRSDLEDRRFCPFSVDSIIEELDRLEMFED